MNLIFQGVKMKKIILLFSFLISIYFLFSGEIAFAKNLPLKLYFNTSEQVNSDSTTNLQLMKDGKKEISNFTFVDLEKLSEELKRYEKKLCFSKKLSFKLWVQISAEDRIVVFSKNVKGGLEILVDCSKE